MKIALVAPSGVSGGVATILHKLYKGLASEGVHVDLFRLSARKFPLLSTLLSTICSDILNAKRLMNYDIVLYIGSIPWPSHVIAKLSGVPVALFLHGFAYHELFHKILHGTRLRNRADAAISTVILRTATSFNTVDLYICHSLTACEANRISGCFVLPQWVSREELKTPEQRIPGRNDIINIVTYTSYARSPRLLNAGHLLALARLVERRANRRFKLIVVDPRGHAPSSSLVKTVRPMPREEFLSLLASAYLYIERCVDEELGISALEAMAIGTPVAKVTHPKYWDRQDYGEEDLVLARSLRELAEKISEYINDVEHYYHYYSKRCREFVLTKRTWDAVKEPFLTALKSVATR